MKKVIRKIGDILLILMIVFLAWFIYNYKMYIVISGSMEPTIRTKELIVVKKHTAPYKIGDVISYYDHNYDIPITHRIVEYNDSNNSYITKGDNNNVNDKLVLEEKDIIGKVVFQSYKLGTLILKYEIPFIIFTGSMILICLLILIIKCIRGTMKSHSSFQMEGEMKNEQKTNEEKFTKGGDE